MKRRVVITGMTSISPLGSSPEQLEEGIRIGSSPARILDLFPAETFPHRVVTQVDNNMLNYPARDIPEYSYFYRDRKTLIGIIAIIKAFAEFKWHIPRSKTNDFGISLGLGVNNIVFEKLLRYFTLRNSGQLVEFYREIISSGNQTQIAYDYISRWIRKYWGFSGYTLNNLSACAASTQAIGTAYRWIKYGKTRVVITGGIDSIINPVGIAGFSLLGTLSNRNEDPKRASRPFAKKRDGFVPGEGAGILFLEDLEHAISRNAKIYGEICGYGSSMDAYKMTAPCSDGYGAALAMKNALTDANWTVDDVEYINAHGTSTFLNDITETRAIKSIFGNKAYSIPVSSCKSQLGHLIAASGAVEVIACLLAMRKGFLPATINLEEPDIECDLDYIPNVIRFARISKFLKNSFALGGQNATLAIKVFNDSSD